MNLLTIYKKTYTTLLLQNCISFISYKSAAYLRSNRKMEEWIQWIQQIVFVK